MKLNQYIKEVVDNASKYRVLDSNFEINRIYSELKCKFNVTMIDGVTEEIREYVDNTFNEEYIHYYLHKI